MKTLYESILDDIDVSLARGEADSVLGKIFSNNIQARRTAFANLLTLVKNYNAKQHNNTAKMKSSDSYFVQFTQPLGFQNGELTGILDYISYIQICKQTDSSYRTVCISTSEHGRGDTISFHELSWKYTQPFFNPKASNNKLYEVPEELNSLFEQIQKEASKHK